MCLGVCGSHGHVHVRSLLSPGTWHIPPCLPPEKPTCADTQLLSAPLPHPFSALRGSFLRQEPWVVKLRTGPPAESAVCLPSVLCYYQGKQRPYQLGALGGNHSQGQWEEHMAELGSNSDSHHTCRTLGKPCSMPQFLLFISGVALTSNR